MVIGLTDWSPIQSVIIRVITKSDDRAAGVRFVLSRVTERHEVLLSINYKNYNFREKEKQRSYEKRGKFALKY